MKKVSIFVLFMFILVNAHATSDPYTAKIDHLRVESVYGFITMEGVLPWGDALGCSKSRVWLDLRNEIDKIKYSTALAAMMAGKKAYIRVVDVPNNLVFGACKLNDIVVYAD
jgi:hypothetical protein